MLKRKNLVSDRASDLDHDDDYINELFAMNVNKLSRHSSNPNCHGMPPVLDDCNRGNSERSQN